MRRLALALLLLVAVARAGDPFAASAEVRKRYTVVVGDGALASVASGTSLTARVASGSLHALDTTLEAGEGGRVHVELRTTAHLYASLYALEITDGKTVLATAPFRVGTEAQEVEERERLRAWLVAQRAQLRDLSALLERRAAYHRQRLLDASGSGGVPPNDLAHAQKRAWERLEDNFALKYRTLRMEFLRYEREVVLSPFPMAGAALSAFFPAIQERRKELEGILTEALAGRAVSLETARSKAIEKIALDSALGLGLPGNDGNAWSADVFGTPERGTVKDGVFTSDLGPSFAAPRGEGWVLVKREVRGDDFHEDRVLFEHETDKTPDGASVRLRVRELPDATGTDDLDQTVELYLNEEFGGLGHWKGIESTRGDGRYRVLGRMVEVGKPSRLLLVVRATLGGKRIFELRCTAPEDAWEARRAELENVAESFKLPGDK
ncbi:MAG TPA: hypothetical protein VFF73_02380 [Planctomycetota bacterium]|nr:hypothetical protein [Planctomycetota bacterium]